MDINELRRLSVEYKMSLNYIAKDEKITELLLSLQNIDNIILKGGTAINRCFLKDKGVMRFSEDIDFDYFTNLNIKKSINELKKKVISKIKGFEIEKARIMHETIRFDLFYINPLGMKDRIMLEFRIKNKPFKKIEKRIVDFGFVPGKASLLYVYNIEELIMQKIMAFLERLDGKDIYDLFYLLEFEYNKDLIKQFLKKEFKEKLIKQLDKALLEYKTIQNSLNHYIPKDLRPDWKAFILEFKNKILKF